MQKAFQGGRVLALVGQREGVEFGWRIGVVRTETCQPLLAAAPGAEQRCIELEGRDVIRPCRKIFQEDTGRAEGDIALGLLAETLPQALAAAVVGEGEELRLVEADERSLQLLGKATV